MTILSSFLCEPYCGRCQEKKSGAVTTGVAIKFFGDFDYNYIRKAATKSYPSPPVTLRKVLY